VSGATHRGTAERLRADLWTAATMPRITVLASRGEPAEDEILRSFRRRHPRYKLVGRKVVGVALLRLDAFDDVDGYLAGLRYARRRVRRAERLGYDVSEFDPSERRAELHDIRTSLPERQGRPMDAEFLDPDAAYPTGPAIEYLGVFRDDVLRAYVNLEYAGEIVGMMDLFGHGDALADGVMFLLTAGVVDRAKTARPATRFVYYDTFFGASDGLRSFKANAGFRPYWVRWRREPPLSARTPPVPSSSVPGADT
jgi:hypothetical protein